MEVIKDRVFATGRVSDDRHAIYMPALLQLDDVAIDWERRPPIPLIVYDGAMRGDFRKGDELRCYGMLVRVTQGREEFDALLVNLYNQLERTC
jgi:hypothetical protein